MKKIIILMLTTLFLVTSCDSQVESKIDPVKSKIKTDAAKKSFSDSLIKVKNKLEPTTCDEGDECYEKQINNPEDMDIFDFTKAYALYNEAVIADPSNLDAQLGAAITRILALFKDTEFIKLRNAYWGIDESFRLDSANLTETRMKISTFINNSLLPAINYSLDRLAILDTLANKDYSYKITPDFYGETEGDILELDMTEIKLFHAVLLGVKSSISISQAYKIDLSDYSLEGIKAALTKGSDFLTLLSSAKMVNALNTAKQAVDKGLDGLNFLLAETDNQDDDLIKNTPDNKNDIENGKDILLKIKDALNGSYEFKNHGVTLNMNIPNFFNNAPTDLKALLPDYTIEIKDGEININPVAENATDLIFPDTTFGGLFEGSISQDDMKLFLEIYECSSSYSCYGGEEDYHCTDDFQCEYGATCTTDLDCDINYEHCGSNSYCVDGKSCSSNADCESYETCNADGICE